MTSACGSRPQDWDYGKSYCNCYCRLSPFVNTNLLKFSRAGSVFPSSLPKRKAWTDQQDIHFDLNFLLASRNRFKNYKSKQNRQLKWVPFWQNCWKSSGRRSWCRKHRWGAGLSLLHGLRKDGLPRPRITLLFKGIQPISQSSFSLGWLLPLANEVN